MNANYNDFLKESARQRARVIRMRQVDSKTGKPRYTFKAIADQLNISRQRAYQIAKSELEKSKAAAQ